MLLRLLRFLLIISILSACSDIKSTQDETVLNQAFQNPPESARPWVFWIWTNGNISKEGITADLEAMERVGLGGALWYETGSPWWPPAGKVAPYSTEWYELMQWAIQESDRLGLGFAMNLGYGYGSGGPHITPDISMQKLYWSNTVIEGGRNIDTILIKPEISVEGAAEYWLKRAGHQDEKVVDQLKKLDTYKEAETILTKMEQIGYYKDVAVLAIPATGEFQNDQIPQLDLRSGLHSFTYFLELENLSDTGKSYIAQNQVINLTEKMNPDGTISWDAPKGQWQIIRFGHASNFRLSRPVPKGAVGLECDKLSTKGIDAHFNTFLKTIAEKAGTLAGKTFKYIHIASYEDGPQNWTAELPSEFKRRRGYDLYEWLPALSGQIIESPELTERFFWDFRKTVSELTLENYHLRLSKLSSDYNISSSREAYGNLCIDNLKYFETCDFPVGEFWQTGQSYFPDFAPYNNTLKVAASASHVYNYPRAGAEAFTYTGRLRSWKEYPFLLKGLGDGAFCEGINHLFLHLYCHQAYDNMIPGLTHRHAGGHFHRHNTWWDYSKPWIKYLTRCQQMLQQGKFVADVIYFFGEGAPLNVKDTKLNLPPGYDYDVCSYDVLQQMQARNGKIVLPSGMSYNYLLLPNNDRLTLSAVVKIEELIKSGAKVIAQKRLVGTPGLSDYPEGDNKVIQIATQLWEKGQIITESNWEKIFQTDNLHPDFIGNGINYIHRKTDREDIYFIANPEQEVIELKCSFRVSGKIPELWNPDTGMIKELTDYEISDGYLTIPIRFEPLESWFIVFQKKKSGSNFKGKNFPEYIPVKDIDGPWQVIFDPKWGGPENPVVFDSLTDWSIDNELGIKYYSGTATYTTKINLSQSDYAPSEPIWLDLGKVEVMAKVKMNGRDCGIAWKPPYLIDISDAVKPGENELKIDVVNLWANRMIGDEQLPEDCEWIDWQVLREWPEWFVKDDVPRTSGRYTFTPVKVFEKDDALYSSGLLGPVCILKNSNE